MKKSETDKKCREIIEEMVRVANSKGLIAFEEDFGENTLTILVGTGDQLQHTHIGFPECSFEQLVDSLHNLLIKKAGLNWC